jgi:hypothetical protein
MSFGRLSPWIVIGFHYERRLATELCATCAVLLSTKLDALCGDIQLVSVSRKLEKTPSDALDAVQSI